ncbi:hypothetical protein EGW08_010133, partial [Elysia chlorotica]
MPFTFRWLAFFAALIIYHLSAGSEISAEDGPTPDLKSSLEVDPNSQISNKIPDSDTASQDDAGREDVKESLDDAQHFEELYSGGVTAYNNHLWYSCASKLERAVNGYKLYARIVSDCRLDCKRNPSQSKLSNLSSSVENFDILASFLIASDCLRRCADENFGYKYVPISRWALNIFRERKAYEYLQFCYHKLDQPKKAASAAYTYFLSHPEDETSKKNVVYYRDGARVAESDFLDMEMVPYKMFFLVRALVLPLTVTLSDLPHQITLLIIMYIPTFLTFINCPLTVATHHLSACISDWMLRILTCQSQCEKELSKVFVEPTDGFVRDMYSYLQYAYASLQRFDKAVVAAANFLVFDPEHKGMLENKKILMAEGYREEEFTPQQVKEYVEQNLDIFQEVEDSYEKLGMDEQDDWQSRYEQLGIKVVANSVDLNRAERFVTDGVLKSEQCDELMKLTESGALVGDGYEHLKTKPSEISPHTQHELFRGITIYRASKLAYEEKISLGALRDFLELSENSRLFAEKYFNLTKPLYFDFTHLVCRTAVDGTYIFLLSAILYLNDDFEGGEFFFAHANQTEQVSVRPKCGRLVAFNAGHFHGVKAVKRGQRCALALWFTQQSMYKELAHIQV